jgi:hypothetical protein
MSVLNDVEVASESWDPTVPEFVRDLTAVAVAVIGRDGTLKDANQGFLNLMTSPSPHEPAAAARDLFVNPRFYQFAARTTRRRDRVLYRGIVNLGREDGRVVSLKGTVYDHDHDLLVVAEHDLAELERLNATFCQLNRDLEQNQRELTRLNRQVKYEKTLAEAALRDRDTLLEALSPREEPAEE